MIAKFITTPGALVQGIAITRIVTGLIIAGYGLQIADQKDMEGYAQWLHDVGFPAPLFMAYLGKVIELAGGILLAVGFLTRVVTVPLVITMFVINFIMGDGSVRSDAFLLLLLFLTFFFTGAGKWSLDYWLFARHNTANTLNTPTHG